jgi:hypothetical protein
MSPDCSVELARTSVTLPRSALRVAVGLFLFVQAVYLLAATCHVRGQDQEYYYRIARSIAREHTFAIEPLVFQNKELAGARGRDGLFYAQYAPGLPIALVPLVLAGDRMKELMSGFAANYFWFHKSEGDIGPRVVASYFNILISAITVGLLTLLVVQLGYPVSAAFFTGLSLAVSTFAWGQARIVFVEPLQGLLL